MWIFGWKGPSGFSARSTAEQVTQGIDGTGLTAIVTGASSGIGVETVRVLALTGVHAVMAVRNVEAGSKVKEEILKEIPSAKVDVMHLDLSSLASVRKFASEYISSGLPLNILMRRADSFYAFPRQHRNTIRNKPCGSFSSDGTSAGHHEKYSTPKLQEGRIINVSSESHIFTYREGIRFDKINEQSGYKCFLAYGQSKLANILHAGELARLLKEDGVNITANSLHPGGISTNLTRHNSILNTMATLIAKYVLKNVQQGAATTCYVALHPQVKGVTGQYFDNSNLSKPSSLATDAELAKKLWDFSLKLVDQFRA